MPYELEPVPAGAAWVGLSEIVLLEDGTFGLIERDNLTGDFSQLKWLTKVDLSAPVTRADKAVHDLLPDLRAGNGWITDKPEGFTVAADGRAYVVTDNDGVEDWTGETQLLDLGRIRRLLLIPGWRGEAMGSAGPRARSWVPNPELWPRARRDGTHDLRTRGLTAGLRVCRRPADRLRQWVDLLWPCVLYDRRAVRCLMPTP